MPPVGGLTSVSLGSSLLVSLVGSVGVGGTELELSSLDDGGDVVVGGTTGGVTLPGGGGGGGATLVLPPGATGGGEGGCGVTVLAGGVDGETLGATGVVDGALVVAAGVVVLGVVGASVPDSPQAAKRTSAAGATLRRPRSARETGADEELLEEA